MTLLLILAIVITLACLTPIFFGVYVDHVRRRRRARTGALRSEYRTAGDQRRLALQVIGGSYHDSAPRLP